MSVTPSGMPAAQVSKQKFIFHNLCSGGGGMCTCTYTHVCVHASVCTCFIIMLEAG